MVIANTTNLKRQIGAETPKLAAVPPTSRIELTTRGERADAAASDVPPPKALTHPRATVTRPGRLSVSAQNTCAQARLLRAQAQAKRLTSPPALFQALDGGWRIG